MMDSQLLDAIATFVESQKALIDQIESLKVAVTELKDAMPQEKTPTVRQLQSQIAKLQARDDDREAFIAKLYQSVIAELIALVPETKYKIGTAFERRKKRLEELNKRVQDVFSK